MSPYDSQSTVPLCSIFQFVRFEQFYCRRWWSCFLFCLCVQNRLCHRIAENFENNQTKTDASVQMIPSGSIQCYVGCWIRNRFMVRAYIDVVQQLGKIKRSLCFVCISYCSDWFVPESAVIDVCSYINRFLIVPASMIDILLMFKYHSHWIDWTFLLRIESLLRFETHSDITTACHLMNEDLVTSNLAHFGNNAE